MKNRKFEIDPQHLTSINVREEYYKYADAKNPTQEEIIETLMGHNKIATLSTADHPAFAELREKLQELGHIEIQRHWWNGDKVLKPFKLNGYQFSKGQQFASASALAIQMKCHNLKMKFPSSLVMVKTKVTAKSRKLIKI